MTDEERIIWLTAFAAANIQFSYKLGPNKSVAECCIIWANTAVENFKIAKSSECTPAGIFK